MSVATYRFNYLHLNVEDANPTLLGNIFHGLDTGTIVVPSKLRMFNEPIFAHKVQEVRFGCEIIFAPMLLTRSWSSGGVCTRQAMVSL